MSQRGDVTQQLALLRESASRARRLALTMIVSEDRERLIRYAEELEQQALELEQHGGPAVMPPPVQQVQVQVQQQQQRESGPPAAATDDDDPKSRND